MILDTDTLYRIGVDGALRRLRADERISIVDPAQPERLITLPWPDARQRFNAHGLDARGQFDVLDLLYAAIDTSDAPWGYNAPFVADDGGYRVALRLAAAEPEPIPDDRTLAQKWAATAQQRKLKEAAAVIAYPLDDSEIQKRIDALDTLRSGS